MALPSRCRFLRRRHRRWLFHPRKFCSGQWVGTCGGNVMWRRRQTQQASTRAGSKIESIVTDRYYKARAGRPCRDAVAKIGQRETGCISAGDPRPARLENFVAHRIRPASSLARSRARPKSYTSRSRRMGVRAPQILRGCAPPERRVHPAVQARLPRTARAVLAA